MRVDRHDMHVGEPPRAQHLGQRSYIAFFRFYPEALDHVSCAARVDAYHRVIHGRQRAVKVRFERTALQPDTHELAVPPLQAFADHVQVRVHAYLPHDPTGLVHNEDGRLLAVDIQSRVEPYRCTPSVVRESPAKGSILSPESSNLMYCVYDS